MKHEEREVRQIYNDYGDDLYRLCYFYTGNVHDAMDAVQNRLAKHYIEDGFSDYILTSDLRNELKKIIEKY